MKNPNWLTHSMDDVVFDGRNQSYGAFQLRRLYDKHMSRGMLVGVLFFLLAISSPKIIDLIKGYMPEQTEDIDSRIVTLAAPPPIIPNTPPPPAPPEVKPPPIKDQIKFVPPVVVNDDDERNEDTPPTVEQLEGQEIATETKEGVEGGIDASIIGDVPSAPLALEEPVEDAPFAYVEQMPSFPGGLEAMYKFITDELDYPVMAKENRISGQAVVQFVVSKEGEILEAKVIKELGGGCGKEALRVVNMMPRWKPGMHNGRAVAVTFTLPIKFILH